MGEIKYYKKTVNNVVKIFNILKEYEKGEKGFLTVSKISKISGLHKWTVSRVLDLYLYPYIEITTPEHLDEVGLNLKLVRLKGQNLNIENLIRYLELSRKI
jgi:hypothetical protein